MNVMTLRDIVKKGLEHYGAEGLCCDCCGCGLDDLMYCDSPDVSECVAANPMKCDGKTIKDCEGCEYFNEVCDGIEHEFVPMRVDDNPVGDR